MHIFSQIEQLKKIFPRSLYQKDYQNIINAFKTSYPDFTTWNQTIFNNQKLMQTLSPQYGGTHASQAYFKAFWEELKLYLNAELIIRKNNQGDDWYTTNNNQNCPITVKTMYQTLLNFYYDDYPNH